MSKEVIGPEIAAPIEIPAPMHEPAPVEPVTTPQTSRHPSGVTLDPVHG